MTQLKDEVTQADIDAARSIEWVNTAIDNHEAIAETFARHRIAHARPADDVVEAARPFTGPATPYDADHCTVLVLKSDHTKLRAALAKASV